MAEVSGLTAQRMLEIEGQSVVDGEVIGDDLFLVRYDESVINAGNVRGAQGPQGADGVSYASNSSGLVSSGTVSAPHNTWTRMIGLVPDAAYPTIGNKVTNGGAIIRVHETGLYLCIGTVQTPPNGTGRRGIAFDNNPSPSAAYANTQHANMIQAPSSNAYTNGVNPLYCQALDYIRMWVWQDSGSALNVGGSATTFIKVVKL